MRTIQRDIVGAFIFSSDKKILLGKGGVYKDCWLVPGGGIEPGETSEEAVIREVLEETGIDISHFKLQPMNGALSGESEKTLRDTQEKVLVAMNFYNYTVEIPIPSEQIKLITVDDFLEPRWFRSDELYHVELSPPTKTSLIKIGFIEQQTNQ